MRVQISGKQIKIWYGRNRNLDVNFFYEIPEEEKFLTQLALQKVMVACSIDKVFWRSKKWVA